MIDIRLAPRQDLEDCPYVASYALPTTSNLIKHIEIPEASEFAQKVVDEHDAYLRSLRGKILI